MFFTTLSSSSYSGSAISGAVSDVELDMLCLLAENGRHRNPNEDDDKVVKNIPQETLLRFISELPDGYRTVFNLFTFENKSHKEIANLLHINEKSSSSQLHRARTILMNRVKQYWAQYENG